ncbi:hypothetical protein [Runella slithyformis]|uniref:Uncharacterized protein n=1 Tax=Runella slithyformis (strain ATCC 29530 / DSM 19594 / LMG 11500 / NCIMB 11436 / LSU 4) TaxID=761193 RepID=A0A7U3ZPM0_RUNSL|nr:hypothetical protein [Runella slithyformis]AEI50993.1 hypothetical protein Runsl_4674 [Runella slithyformis DSM 19594]
MKKILLCMGVWLGVVSACKNPIDGLEIRFKKPYPVALDVQYYTAAGDSVPTSTQVILTGPDADRLITTVNTKKIKVSSDGALYLSIDSLGPRPSPEKPLRYTVVVKSPGFVDAILPVEMKRDVQRSAVMIMQRVGAQSPVSIAQTNADGQGALNREWSFETSTPILSGQSPAQALLPKGTQLKDVQGAVVSGTLTARFQSVDITKPLTTFLNNPITNQTIVKPLLPGGAAAGANQQLTQVAGAFLLQLHNDQYQLVKTLSQPMQVRFSVSPQLYHPMERRAVQAGDAIPLYSYDAATEQWQTETPGKLQKSANDGLEYVAELSHLSLWVAGFTKQKCDTGPSFKIKSSLPATNLQYRAEVINDATGARLQVFNTTVNNGEVIKISGLESDQFVRLRLNDVLGTAVVNSALVNGCSGEVQEVDVSSFKKQIQKCPNGPGFKIRSVLPNSDYRYSFTVVNAETNAQLQSFQTTANNNEIIRLSGLDSDQKVRLRIADIVSSAVAVSEPVDACAGNTEQVIDITSFKIPPQRCAASPVFRISSTLPNSDRRYSFEVIDAETKGRIQFFQTTANNGELVRLGGFFDNTGKIQLRIYDIVSAAQVLSGVVESCSNVTLTLVLENFKTPPPKCTVPLGFRVKSILPSSSAAYQVQVINAANGGVMQSFSSTINNGQVININGLYSEETVRLRIMDNLSGAVALSAAVGGCNTTLQEIDVSSFKKPILKCPSPLTFSVRSSLPVSGRIYNGEVIRVSDNTVLQTFTTSLNNGNVIRINGLDAEQNVRLRIYDSQSTAIANSASVDACDAGTQIIDVTSFRVPPDIKPGQVLITLQFPCNELDKTKLPTLVLYGRFRETGTLQWKSLPNLAYAEGKSSFSILTDLLEVGKTYDFQAGPAPGYYSFSENAYKLEKADWIIRIKTDEYCK